MNALMNSVEFERKKHTIILVFLISNFTQVLKSFYD